MRKIWILPLVLLVGCGSQGDPQNTAGSGSQQAAIDHGKALYATHGCAACHGANGSGDGPIAGSLTSPPRDLSKLDSYRQGTTLAEVAETLRLGVNGTAMPPYPHIPEEERVAMAEFLVSLQESAPAEAEAGAEETEESDSIYSKKRLLVHEGLGGEFSLTNQDGEPYSLSDGDGKIRLLFFGFTSCPDVCPMTLSKVTRIRKLLREDADEVVTLLVSVDPEVDTPEKLKEYLGYFDLGQTLGLTGTQEEIDSVLELFSGYSDKKEAETATGYVVNHTSYLYLIDSQSRVRALFQYSASPAQIAAAIRALVMGVAEPEEENEDEESPDA